MHAPAHPIPSKDTKGVQERQRGAAVSSLVAVTDSKQAQKRHICFNLASSLANARRIAPPNKALVTSNRCVVITRSMHTPQRCAWEGGYNRR